ncbi:MAG: hypothetical protein IPH71_12485 [Proteobacteria bacterium]|nr:hypothetical protein [Pseudomonadota bacterium]
MRHGHALDHRGASHSSDQAAASPISRVVGVGIAVAILLHAAIDRDGDDDLVASEHSVTPGG